MKTRALCLALLAFAAPGAALACSCWDLTMEENIAAADLIFEGVAIESECGAVAEITAAPWEMDDGCTGTRTAQFSIAQSWKGQSSGTVSVAHDAYTSCGILFLAGEKYLISATYDEELGGYHRRACAFPVDATMGTILEALDAYSAETQAAADAP